MPKKDKLVTPTTRPNPNAGTLWEVSECPCGPRRVRAIYEAGEEWRDRKLVPVGDGSKQWYIPGWMDHVLSSGFWTSPGDVLKWDCMSRCGVRTKEIGAVVAGALAARGRRDTFSVDVDASGTARITRRSGLKRLPAGYARTWVDDREKKPYVLPRRGPEPRAVTAYRFEDLVVGSVAVYGPDVAASDVHNRWKSWCRVRAVDGKILTRRLKSESGAVVGLWVERLA